MPFCNEKLKIIAKGIQMVSEVERNVPKLFYSALI
jgi:hypothetical protein